MMPIAMARATATARATAKPTATATAKPTEKPTATATAKPAATATAKPAATATAKPVAVARAVAVPKAAAMPASAQHAPPTPGELTDEMKELSIARAFQMFDIDRSGGIDARELQQALAQLGMEVDSAQARQVLAEYDCSGQGKLDLHGFSRLVEALIAFQAGEPHRASQPHPASQPLPAPHPAAPPQPQPQPQQQQQPLQSCSRSRRVVCKPMARAGAGTRCNLSHCGWYSATGLQLAPADPLAWRTRVRELRVTVQPAGPKGLGVFAAQQHDPSASLAVPQLRGQARRAWRLRAAQHSKGEEMPNPLPPSHRLRSRRCRRL